MMGVGLAAVPNQTLSVQLDSRQYEISFREANGVMAVSVTRDGEVLVTNARVTAGAPLLPYRYQESGNFIVTTEGDALPYYDQFEVTQFLVYVTAAELAALRGA